MSDKTYESFLRRQQEEALALAKASDVMTIIPEPVDPPARYVAVYNARGLVQNESGRIETFDVFAAQIWMPPDYLLRAEPPEVLTYFGLHPRP
jgi:hypothetical protein